MIRLAKRTFREGIKRDWSCGKSTSKTPLWPWAKPWGAWKVGAGAGSGLCGSKAAMACGRVVSGAVVVEWAREGGSCGLSWMLGMVCVYAQPLRSGDPRVVRAVWRALLLPSGEGADCPQGAESAGAQHLAAWRASPPTGAEEADLPARQRGLQLLHLGWFDGPELKDESEASEDDQTDNVSNEALCVIGLDGSGDKVSRYLQDWEVAKVALSCHIALDMPCQEVYEVEKGDEIGSVSERACWLSDKPL